MAAAHLHTFFDHAAIEDAVLRILSLVAGQGVDVNAEQKLPVQNACRLGHNAVLLSGL